jgi:DHA2 family methylenomycin A resistance protein-like MFS transporter
VTATAPQTSSLHARTTLVISSGAFFLTTLDILIVNIALSSIGRDLGGGTSALQWVVDGYTLVFAALLLCTGNLADRIGARRAMGAGVILFGLTSVLCALAPSTGMLVGARAGQGAAAALILPASMALLREAYPDPGRRAHALGVWTAAGAVAAAAGPLLGGLLTTLDWRLVFAINIPVCLVMALLMGRVAPSPRRPAPFDWAGQVLALIALSALIFGLIEGGARGFSDPVVLGALILAVVGLVAFVITEARVRHPMMPLTLFRSAGLRISLMGGFAFIGSWFGTVFVLSLYFQQELGMTPLAAGLAFIPSALVSLLGNLVSGPVVARFGPRFPAVLGLASITLGLLLLIPGLLSQSPLLLCLLILLVGGGGSIAMPPLTGLVLSSVESEQSGIASAVLNAFRQVGGALAIAAMGALASSAAGFVGGAQIGFALAAAVALAAMLAALRIGRTERLTAA